MSKTGQAMFFVKKTGFYFYNFQRFCDIWGKNPPFSTRNLNMSLNRKKQLKIPKVEQEDKLFNFERLRDGPGGPDPLQPTDFH